MHPIANHLIQLQELALIREEQEVMTGRSRLEELDRAIAEMVAKLPEDVRTLYQRLKEKDPITIAPVFDNRCTACAMHLPISLAQAVRMEREIHSCPNCARLLYAPETPIRGIGRRTSRVAPQKTGISRFSAEGLMIPSLGGDTAEAVIREMATRLRDEGFVDRVEELVEAALRREAIISTAVGNGLAFPHVRGVEGGGLSLVLGLSRRGIAWPYTPDGKPVRILFFIAIPTAATAFYLKLLSGLTTTFTQAEARRTLLSCKTPETLWKTLIKVTRSSVK